MCAPIYCLRNDTANCYLQTRSHHQNLARRAKGPRNETTRFTNRPKSRQNITTKGTSYVANKVFSPSSAIHVVIGEWRRLYWRPSNIEHNINVTIRHPFYDHLTLCDQL